MRRLMMIAAACGVLAVPVGAVAFAGAPVGAVSHHASKVTCTTVTGSQTAGTITFGGCSDPATGGSTAPLEIAVLGSGGTITWTSGTTTVLGTPTLTAPPAKRCPGFVHPTRVNPTPNNPTAIGFTGAVTSDTGDNLKPGGTYRGAICLSADPPFTFTMLKPLSIR